MPRKHGLANYVNLLLEVADANNLRCTISRYSFYVILWGFEEDIDVAERIYGSLLTQMIAASEAWLNRGEYKTETFPKEVKWYAQYDPDDDDSEGEWITSLELRPMPKQTARTNFQQAYARRIGARLAAAKRETEQTAVAFESSGDDSSVPSTSTAVVLRQKAAEVDDYFENREGKTSGRWKGGSSSGHSSSATAAGRAAANNARLGAPTALGGARTAIR